MSFQIIEMNKEFMIGNEEIKIKKVKQYNQLGVLFGEVGTGRAKSLRTFRVYQWWQRLCSMVNFMANKHKVIMGIWKEIAVPCLMYGMDTTVLAKLSGSF